MPAELMTGISIVFYTLGAILAVEALWRSRTPQGAAAWAVGLLGFPFVAVPAFLVFGRNKFYGYVKERRELDEKARQETADVEKLAQEHVPLPATLFSLGEVARRSRQPGFMGHNRLGLLIDGEQTYAAMIDAIESATKYILFQFYVFREDDAGQRFKEALLRKAKTGVRVYFLYDQIGSTISNAFLHELESHGIEIKEFRSTKIWTTRFQINFRNHRKVVVIDGVTAFIGGLNIGDDYLGLWKSMGPWRDTHMRVDGPAALAAQFSFAKDWYWAKETVPDLDWQPKRFANGAGALILHTGPADDVETCLMAHLSLFESAAQRIWISNPYFVPSEGIVNILALSAIKGIDVRVVIPSYSDNRSISFASEIYIEKLLEAGVKFFKYRDGFLHQKVVLIDDVVAMVGSANMDSRSLFINFEIMAVATDKEFVAGVEKMLSEDLRRSEEVKPGYFLELPLWQRFAARVANLFVPLL